MQYTLSVGFCPADWYVPLARAAEAAGWDSIAVPDGLFYYEKTSAPYPYSADGSRFWAADTPFLDPWASMAPNRTSRAPTASRRRSGWI